MASRRPVSPSCLAAPVIAALALLAGACQAPVLQTDARAIINGEQIGSDEFPSAAALVSSYTYAGYDVSITWPGCTATLIAADAALTAAHCVDENLLGSGFELQDLEFCLSFESDLSWMLDEEYAGDPPLPHDAVCASGWVEHPTFDLSGFDGGLTQSDDIALVFLDQEIDDRPHAWLVTEAEAEAIVVGLEVDIVGYGQRETDPEVTTSPLRYWAESEINQLAQWEMQIGQGGSDGRKCHGDSGGPTYAGIGQPGDAERLIGVTSHSWGDDGSCEEGGVDTRVDPYLDWIDEQLRSACSQGLRSDCDEPGIPVPGDDDDDAVQDDDDDADDRWSGPDEYQDGTFEEASYGCQSCGSHVAAGGASPLFVLLLPVWLLRRRTPVRPAWSSAQTVRSWIVLALMSTSKLRAPTASGS